MYTGTDTGVSDPYCDTRVCLTENLPNSSMISSVLFFNIFVVQVGHGIIFLVHLADVFYVRWGEIKGS